jgi:hypothetical protein
MFDLQALQWETEEFVKPGKSTDLESDKCEVLVKSKIEHSKNVVRHAVNEVSEISNVLVSTSNESSTNSKKPVEASQQLSMKDDPSSNLELEATKLSDKTLEHPSSVAENLSKSKDMAPLSLSLEAQPPSLSEIVSESKVALPPLSVDGQPPSLSEHTITDPKGGETIAADTTPGKSCDILIDKIVSVCTFQFAQHY